MINRLRSLFQRYASTHRHIEVRGFGLADPTEPLKGHVDRVLLAGTHVTFIGWSTADRVMLRSAEGSAITRPDIPRQDVADALGCSPRVGFEISQPYGDGRFSLTVDQGGVEHRHDVAPIPPRQLSRNRRELALRFAGTLIRALPDIVRAMHQNDPAARARVKAALGLNAVPVAGPMETQLFLGSDLPEPQDPLPITVILPIYNAFDLLPDVLDRVLRHTDLPWHLILIEDCSSDPQVRPFLRDWAAAREADHPGQVDLVENAQNKGFIGSVNSGLTRAREIGNHVVLLNSDAFVPENWASRLLRPILRHDDVASVTPMSNDAEIFSVPAICQRMPLQPGQGDAIDAVAQRFHPEAVLTVAPTGVGFCMAMNIDYVKRLPLLDTVFGRGYGEEVDWCQKARALGGRHLGLPGLFVEHRGGESFGSEEKLKLVLENNAVISSRYPDYDAEVQLFLGADPLITARLALAISWAASRADAAPIPIYLAHSLGGGADKYLERRIADDIEQTGRPSIVLRVGDCMGRWRLELVSDHGTTAGVTDDFDFVERLLEPITRRHVVYSCGVGDSDPVTLPDHLLRLRRDGDTLEILTHDFFMLSPSYTLLDGDGIYRGMAGVIEADPIHEVLRPNGATVALRGWRYEWGKLMHAADQITVFSDDSRLQLLAVFPETESQIVLRPHELLADVPRIIPPAQTGGVRTIAVLGNIGFQKGAAVVAGLGRLFEARSDLQLVVIGNVDPAYTPPASVPVHGNYRLADLPGLVDRYGITDWLVPSIWPETFSYTTHEAIATGLPVYVFDIGAQHDAVRSASNGHLIPFTTDGTLPMNVFNTLMQENRQVAE